MNKIGKMPVALAVAAAFGTSASTAAVIPVKLITVRQGDISGTSQAQLTGSTATWTFNTDTGVVTGTGVYQALYRIYDLDILTEQITDLSVGGGTIASAASFSCVEGEFGAAVSASICGGYDFGDNNTDESIATWGPGIAFDRTIGGDDEIVRSQLNLSWYDGMTTSYSGGTSIELFKWFPDSATSAWLSMEFNTVIPVPPAAWLFGSALAVLGWVRRRNN